MRFCFRCLKRSNNALQDTLDGLGYFVGRRWGLTMIWSALLLLLLFSGLSQIKFADEDIPEDIELLYSTLQVTSHEAALSTREPRTRQIDACGC